MKTFLHTLLIVLLLSCSSNDDNPTSDLESTPTSEINIEEAKLSGFPLFAIAPTKINIIHPEIVNNKEVKYGEIEITVANGTSMETISALITSEELNLSKFSVFPSNDVKLSYENQKVNIYTIKAATGNKEELLHYNVRILEEEIVVPETLKITNFVFEKSKNPSLPNDIEISKTIEGPGIDKMYFFVPVGTDFTNLTPTITFEGTKLYYTQDSSIAPVNINVEYPEEDTPIDFKYPKDFILVIKDSTNDQLKTISVIVDVINPVKIEIESFISPDVTKGASSYFPRVTKWTNQGNHKVTFQKANTYENTEPITPTQVITAFRSLPSGGLLPGESADINIAVNATNYPEGTYKTTAIFHSRIQYNEGVDDLLTPAELTITSKVIN